jgi:hypothetical protein
MISPHFIPVFSVLLAPYQLKLRMTIKNNINSKLLLHRVFVLGGKKKKKKKGKKEDDEDLDAMLAALR